MTAHSQASPSSNGKTVTGQALPLSQVSGETPPIEILLPEFQKFVETIARLRAPDGCPWDREQTLKSVCKHTLEETYELIEAIEHDDNIAIVEELGDVLLQVILDAQIGRDEQRFDLIDVIRGVTAKMIHRHPHVFGNESASTANDVKVHWENAKQQEKQRESILDGLPREMPALARAARLSEKAARAGYDFPQREMLFSKLNEEIEELQVELFPAGIPEFPPATVEAEVMPDRSIEHAEARERVQSELGDVLFVLANIARRWHINPEEALRSSNQKFERRFRAIETAVQARGKKMSETSLKEMEEIYQQVKRQEKTETHG
ncbi:MazG family protein [Planctopirus limnophila DSM 3776]|uniref:MazG family protein n=1 Tax=Planctopirus limnophila (strain ATCC 43296 / DSM 3776 / IFAM 1008 / Mu 290) TaxID=521674 RepID=D5SVC1_PLAL2|nr:nucleoside triphosphate pyrophosphohydrolase [Planctopirus limnophila]ADG67191.1 MazG family protein [Planctopirus limnophila DSM 3776]